MRKPGWRPNIQGGNKPSVKAPDPSAVSRDDIRFVESLVDSEIRARLDQRGIHPNIVDALVRDRNTNGGRWRIIMELCR